MIDFYVYYPTGYQGYVPLIKSSDAVEYYKFGAQVQKLLELTQDIN